MNHTEAKAQGGESLPKSDIIMACHLLHEKFGSSVCVCVCVWNISYSVLGHFFNEDYPPKHIGCCELSEWPSKSPELIIMVFLFTDRLKSVPYTVEMNWSE